MSTHKYRDSVERLHRERAEAIRFPEKEDPELAAAYRSLQLQWLKEYPHYKEAIKKKVSEAQKRNAKLDDRIYRQSHKDVDYLGQEIEGCG